MFHNTDETGLQDLWSKRALDALPDPVLAIDREGQVLMANRRAEELLLTRREGGPGPESAVERNGRSFSTFRAHHAPDPDGRGDHAELSLIDPSDGSELFFDVLVLPFTPGEDRHDDAVYILRDITALGRATRELRLESSRSAAAEDRVWRESRRLNVVIENAGVPIFVTDRQTKVTLMNREAERLLEVGEVPSLTSPRIHDIRANDEKLARLINEFLTEPRQRTERRLTLVDPEEAREFPVVAVSTKILDEHYEPLAVVTVLRDLTQEMENQHLAEKLRTLNAELEERIALATRQLADRNVQLEAQRAELERASRMKSEFLATMSHELRTPINAILGYNSLLQEGLFGALHEEQEDVLRRTRNAAEHLLSLITDILDLSRVEAGRVELRPTQLDPASFLNTVAEPVRPMAARKSLEFTVSVEPDAPSICADETRLRQVLLNLLSNAVKFTDAGSVSLSARRAPDGDGVRLEVSDTGVGIAEDKLESIFEAFTQVDQSETREHGGVGLGLAISRRFVRAMGGTLSVVSAVGVGTTFRVELPPTSPACEAAPTPSHPWE